MNKMMISAAVCALIGLASTPSISAEPYPNEIGYRDGYGQSAGELVDCPMPVAGKNALVLLVGAANGSGVANVYVSNPNVITTTSTINIKEGPERIYLAIENSEPMIWKLTGAVNRLEKVVLRERNSGVVGVPKNVVAFPEGDIPCKQMPTKEGSFAHVRMKSLIQASIGKDINEVVVKQRFSEVAVPSAEFVKDKTPAELMASMQHSGQRSGQFGIQFLYQLKMKYPGGIANIDPNAVVARKAATAFDVLPKEFGLAALVSAGNLEPTEYNEFRIVKSFDQFPPGLTNLKFVLAKGVAAPKGDVGSNCMISEDTFAMTGKTCR